MKSQTFMLFMLGFPRQKKINGTFGDGEKLIARWNIKFFYLVSIKICCTLFNSLSKNLPLKIFSMMDANATYFWTSLVEHR